MYANKSTTILIAIPLFWDGGGCGLIETTTVAEKSAPQRHRPHDLGSPSAT